MALRAIPACSIQSAIFARFYPSNLFGAEQVFNAQFFTDLFCSILHPYKGVEWSGAEKDHDPRSSGAVWSMEQRYAQFLRLTTFRQINHAILDEQVVFCG